MHALPWDESTFTVATSFRGIWGTTPTAVGEIYRVLAPGGRIGLTVWGHIKASPGAWALGPFRMAAPPRSKIRPQWLPWAVPESAKSSCRRRDSLTSSDSTSRSHGNSLILKSMRGPWHRPDRRMKPFRTSAMTSSRATRWRWPNHKCEMGVSCELRSTSWDSWLGSLSTREGAAMSTIGFLELPSVTPEAQALFDEDVAEDGYVMNVTKLWSHNAALVTNLFDLMRQALEDQSLSFRQRGILVAASASTLGDSYCSLGVGLQAGGSLRPRACSSRDFAGATKVWTTTSASWRHGHARWPEIPTTPQLTTSRACGLPGSTTLRSSPLRSSPRCALRSRRSTMPLVWALTPP